MMDLQRRRFQVGNSEYLDNLNITAQQSTTYKIDCIIGVIFVTDSIKLKWLMMIKKLYQLRRSREVLTYYVVIDDLILDTCM